MGEGAETGFLGILPKNIRPPPTGIFYPWWRNSPESGETHTNLKR